MKIHTALVVACSTAVALPAAAADRKAFHGGSCQQSTWPGGVRRTERGVEAESGGVGVTCPLIRDELDLATSLNNVSMEGYNHSTSAISCWLYSQTEDSSSGMMLDSDPQSVTAQGTYTLNFDVDSTAGNEGSYAIYCFLPSFSRIYHIFVSESDSGSN